MTHDDQEPTISSLVSRLAGSARLDRSAALIARLGGGVAGRISERGQQLLGHPLHPPLTDLPIGFWTSAWVLDMIPGTDAVARRRLVGLGVVSAVPAMFTGLGDAAALDPDRRRLAAVHGALNLSATAAFAISWSQRRRGQRLRGLVSTQLGAALATAAGLVGGHLAFGD